MDSASPETKSSDFYSRALDRIRQLILVLGLAALITAFAVFGWRIGIGFALGSGVSYANFYWLEQIVGGLGEIAAREGGASTSRRVFRRFMLRYILMAVIAFVILTVSRESLYGLFAGLFLPVAAMLCEAGYEVYAALVRGV